MRRRDLVTAVAAAGASAAVAQTLPVQRKGRVKQGVMRVNFDPKMPGRDPIQTLATVIEIMDV